MKHFLLTSRNLMLTMGLLLGFVIGAIAQVTVTPATGGTTISADNAITAPGTATYTALGNIIISSNSFNDFAKNQTNVTFVLTAPANWQFQAATGAVARAGS